MKILHVGLCVDGKNEGLPFAMKKASTFYRELSTGAPDLNDKIIAEANRNSFDIAFFQIQAMDVVDPSTFAYLKSKGIFTVNWSGDIRNGTPIWYHKTGADLTLFTNERDVRNVRNQGKNADFLQIGIDPKVFNIHGIQRIDRQVVFMGNNYGGQFPLGRDRAFMAQCLINSGYSVIGGYSGAEMNLNGNQLEESIVYNNSKIAINHSHFNEPRYTSDRMFRILASGTFCLSHHYSGIEKDFEVGTHLDTYRDIHELKIKIDFYLSHHKERNEIERKGYDLCHEKFTYNNMIENLFNLVKKYK